VLSAATTEDRRTTVPTTVTRRLVQRYVVVYQADPPVSGIGSTTQAKALDQGSVAVDVDLGEIVQQIPATADHQQ
jgi:hypothetical protein